MAALLAAVLAGGCGGDGFDVTAPAGFEDQTDLVTRRSEAKVEALWRSPDAPSPSCAPAARRERRSPTS